MERTIILLLFLIGTITFVSTQKCGECMPNGIACATDNQFFLCNDGVPNRTALFDCPINQVCTALGPFCMSDQESLCLPNQPNYCGKCAVPHGKSNAPQSFICVGPRQYGICENGEELEGYTFTCQVDTFCNMHAYENSGQICVTESVISDFQYPFTCLRPLNRQRVARPPSPLFKQMFTHTRN